MSPARPPSSWAAGIGRACRLGLLMALASVAGAAAGQPAIRIATAVLQGPQAGAPQPVTLPDNWNARQRSGTWEYSMRFDAPAAPAEPWGLFVPRAGNRFAVHLNGHRIGQLGRFDGGDSSDHAQRPHYFFLPEELLLPGPNVLRFVVQGEMARYGGLSNLWVGPASVVRPPFVLREIAQVWGSFATIFVALVFGAIAAALAVSVRERSFAAFAAACLFCALRTSYAVVTEPPMDYRLWAAVIDACYAGFLACVCLFSVEVLRLRRRWITAATAVLVAATVLLLPAYAALRLVPLRQAFLAVMLVYALLLSLTVMRQWYLTRTPQSRVLAAASAISVGLGVHDHVVVFYTADGYAAFALARYALITFVIAMGWLLVERYARQAREEAHLRREVADELQRKRLELEAQFDRQQQLAAENAQQRERRRILQDLHDGMGLQLNGLLGMVQSGPLQRQALSLEVRTAIEQMRMLMDSTEAFEGDVSLLLGHIRYRIEQRLQRQGIRLEWEAGLVQPQRVLPPHRALALQRLVFELATNTLKHSAATAVSCSACDAVELDAPLLLVYADNGCGFDSTAVPAGIGTRSIERRVGDLGGQITQVTGPARGVRYELRIPASAFEPQGAIATGEYRADEYGAGNAGLPHSG